MSGSSFPSFIMESNPLDGIPGNVAIIHSGNAPKMFKELNFNVSFLEIVSMPKMFPKLSVFGNIMESR